jgi:hypothetical protein
MPRPAPRPASPDGNGYSLGGVVVQVMRPSHWVGDPIVSLVAIGPGHADRQGLREAAKEITDLGQMNVWVGEDFPSVTAGLAKWPEAQLGATETALYRQERAIREHQRAVQSQVQPGHPRSQGSRPSDEHSQGTGPDRVG